MTRAPLLRLWAPRAIRLVLAGIFLYAGVVKAGASEQFAVALAPFTFLSDGAAGTLARLLPWIEVAAGFLLLLPRVHRLGSLLVLLLCAAFVTALTWALANGIVVSCGCFGGDEPPSAAAMLGAIVRDLVLAALAATTFLGAIQK